MGSRRSCSCSSEKRVPGQKVDGSYPQPRPRDVDHCIESTGRAMETWDQVESTAWKGRDKSIGDSLEDCCIRSLAMEMTW
jgi:hypothetical protein